MSIIDRAAWSPEEREEFDDLLAEVVAVSRDTTDRLDLAETLLDDAIQAHRPWASEVANSCRREGLGREIKRYQDRQRVAVAYDGRVLSVPAVQARKVVATDGSVSYQRGLIELWTWDELNAKALRGDPGDQDLHREDRALRPPAHPARARTRLQVPVRRGGTARHRA